MGHSDGFQLFLVRDAFFLEYGPRAANNLTDQQIRDAIAAISEGTTISIAMVVKELAKGIDGLKPSVISRKP